MVSNASCNRTKVMLYAHRRLDGYNRVDMCSSLIRIYFGYLWSAMLALFSCDAFLRRRNKRGTSIGGEHGERHKDDQSSLRADIDHDRGTGSSKEIHL